MLTQTNEVKHLDETKLEIIGEAEVAKAAEILQRYYERRGKALTSHFG